MAKARHVYPTREVCHRWAHGSELELRNPTRSVLTDGDTIYSYGSHFPMARRIVLPKRGFKVNGKRQDLVYFLVNSGSYSVTTSGHQSCVWTAINGVGDASFEVPPTFWHELVIGGSGVNVRAYFDGIVRKAEEEMHNNRMGYWRRHCAVQLAAKTIEDWNTLRDAFKLRARKPIAEPALPDLAEAKLKEEARRIKAEETRKAKWAARDEQWRLQRERADREREEQERELRATLHTRLNAWRAGEDVSTRFFSEVVTGAFMRIKHGMIETTMGARVTLDEAARFIAEDLPLVREADCSEGEVHFHDMRLGPYRGVRVSESFLSVGCHNFCWAEVNRMIGELRAKEVE